jgi:hypothetical protein
VFFGLPLVTLVLPLVAADFRSLRPDSTIFSSVGSIFTEASGLGVRTTDLDRRDIRTGGVSTNPGCAGFLKKKKKKNLCELRKRGSWGEKREL